MTGNDGKKEKKTENEYNRIWSETEVGNMAMSADIVRVKSVCYFPPPIALNGRCSIITLLDISSF